MWFVVAVDGKNAYLAVQSDFGGTAMLTLREMVKSSDTDTRSAISFENVGGELLISGTTMKPMASLQDNRTDITSTAATDQVLQDFYDNNALTAIGVTSYGATYINVTTADFRSIYGDGNPEFLSSVGLVKAALTLSHSQETELMIATQAEESNDRVVFSNGTAEFIVIEWDDIILQPQVRL